MNKKAEQWEKFLEDNKITCFGKEEIKTEIHPMLYRAFLEVKGQKLPSLLVLDDSIYTMFQVLIATKVVTEANRNSIENILNTYNRKFKVFKYYINDNDDICLESCMPSTAESFDPTIIQAVIDVVLKHLVEEYPKLMKEIWGN